MPANLRRRPAAPPETPLALQLAASVQELWIAIALSGARLPEKRLLGPILMLGVLNPGVSYTLGFIGLARVSASVSTLLWAAEPLLILGLAGAILREPITWRLTTIGGVGLIGVLLVADIGAESEGGGDPVGVVLILLGVLCCALYSVWSRKLSDRTDPLTALALQQTAGLLWVIGLVLANQKNVPLSGGDALSFSLLGTAALSGLMYYAAAYWLYLTALRAIPAAVAGSYFNLIPVFGVGLAYVFLGEHMRLVQWVGAAAILTASAALVKATVDTDAAL